MREDRAERIAFQYGIGWTASLVCRLGKAVVLRLSRERYVCAKEEAYVRMRYYISGGHRHCKGGIYPRHFSSRAKSGMTWADGQYCPVYPDTMKPIIVESNKKCVCGKRFSGHLVLEKDSSSPIVDHSFIEDRKALDAPIWSDKVVLSPVLWRGSQAYCSSQCRDVDLYIYGLRCDYWKSQRKKYYVRIPKRIGSFVGGAALFLDFCAVRQKKNDFRKRAALRRKAKAAAISSAA